MALTADDIVAAVNAVPGVTPELITRTLTVGGLNVMISDLEDAIARKASELDDARAANDAAVKALRDQRDALVARRRQLAGQ